MGELDFLKDESATSGSPKTVAKKKPRKIKKPPPDMRVKPEVIAEARRLAASPKGLEIDPFFTKHKISVSVDELLHGQLDEDGYLK